MWGQVYDIFYASLMSIIDVRMILTIKIVCSVTLLCTFFPLIFMLRDALGWGDVSLLYIIYSKQ